MYLLVSKFHFLEFRLLLRRVTPYLQFVITNRLIASGISTLFVEKFHKFNSGSIYGSYSVEGVGRLKRHMITLQHPELVSVKLDWKDYAVDEVNSRRLRLGS